MSDPAEWALVVRKNIPFLRVLTVTDDAGAAVNFTGHTALMQVRVYQGADDPALIDLTDVLTETQGVQFSDATGGEITIRIDQATLEALPATDGRNKPTIFWHDLLVYDPEGAVVLCLYGSFTVYTGVGR